MPVYAVGESRDPIEPERKMCWTRCPRLCGRVDDNEPTCQVQCDKKAGHPDFCSFECQHTLPPPPPSRPPPDGWAGVDYGAIWVRAPASAPAWRACCNRQCRRPTKARCQCRHAVCTGCAISAPGLPGTTWCEHCYDEAMAKEVEAVRIHQQDLSETLDEEDRFWRVHGEDQRGVPALWRLSHRSPGPRQAFPPARYMPAAHGELPTPYCCGCCRTACRELEMNSPQPPACRELARSFFRHTAACVHAFAQAVTVAAGPLGPNVRWGPVGPPGPLCCDCERITTEKCYCGHYSCPQCATYSCSHRYCSHCIDEFSPIDVAGRARAGASGVPPRGLHEEATSSGRQSDHHRLLKQFNQAQRGGFDGEGWLSWALAVRRWLRLAVRSAARWLLTITAEAAVAPPDQPAAAAEILVAVPPWQVALAAQAWLDAVEPAAAAAPPPPQAAPAAPAVVPAWLRAARVARAKAAGLGAKRKREGLVAHVPRTPPRPGGSDDNRFYCVVRRATDVAGSAAIVRSWPACFALVYRPRLRPGSGAAPRGQRLFLWDVCHDAIFHGFPESYEAEAYWAAAEAGPFVVGDD